MGDFVISERRRRQKIETKAQAARANESDKALASTKIQAFVRGRNARAEVEQERARRAAILRQGPSVLDASLGYQPTASKQRPRTAHK